MWKTLKLNIRKVMKNLLLLLASWRKVSHLSIVLKKLRASYFIVNICRNPSSQILETCFFCSNLNMENNRTWTFKNSWPKFDILIFPQYLTQNPLPWFQKIMMKSIFNFLPQIIHLRKIFFHALFSCFLKDNIKGIILKF
jgi:hypothetical protein